MCLKTPKIPKVTPPSPPPPPPSTEKPQTPVLDEGNNNSDMLTAKRRGTGSFRIPLGGLNIPT